METPKVRRPVLSRRDCPIPRIDLNDGARRDHGIWGQIKSAGRRCELYQDYFQTCVDYSAFQSGLLITAHVSDKQHW
jgi:hypothetical protein